MPDRPIGMFDSGVGGLTVWKALTDKLPAENLIYYADTARLPYGPKSPETLLRYSIENVIFLIEKEIKVLVIACNTATSTSLEKLQALFRIPMVGVIEPGAEKAVQVSRTGRIAVLGTRATIGSKAYEKTLLQLRPDAQITSIACPLFVPIVEEQFTHHPIAKLAVAEYLLPLKQAQVDTILLGCTHYPLLRQLIQEEMGPDITIVDSASTCADRVAGLLQKESLLAQRTRHEAHHFFASDNPLKFKQLGEEILGQTLENVH